MSDAPRATPALTRASTAAPGRLSSGASIGFAAGAVPPSLRSRRGAQRVRGALAHDVAARYGLSLTEEARREMAEPSRTSRNGAFSPQWRSSRVARCVVSVCSDDTAARRLARSVCAGPLFDRYLERVALSRALRIHDAEARRVRRPSTARFRACLEPRLGPRGRAASRPKSCATSPPGSSTAFFWPQRPFPTICVDDSKSLSTPCSTTTLLEV